LLKILGHVQLLWLKVGAKEGVKKASALKGAEGGPPPWAEKARP